MVPDIRRPTATEVFSVEEVASIDPATRQIVSYRPFFSYRHETDRTAGVLLGGEQPALQQAER